MATAPTSALATVLEETTLDTLRVSKGTDAIIVGAGASGGLAAMLLAQAGARVLVLDAGPPADWRNAALRRLTGKIVRRALRPDVLGRLPASIIPYGRQAIRALGRFRQPIQSQCFAWERAPEAFVDDVECPYVTPPGRPFNWIRSRMLGGRVAVPGHGRQYYRLGPADFAPDDGLSPHWPLQPAELDEWYAVVEQCLGLSGMLDGLSCVPDSILASVEEFAPSETLVREQIVDRWPGAYPIMSRYAAPPQWLEQAARTGRLQCRQGAVVREIEVDEFGNVSGVSWIDHETRSEQRSFAPLVFLSASALESTRLLMLSRSKRSPAGLGGSSDALGRFLMDHVMVGVEGASPSRASGPPWDDGRCLYLPHFESRAHDRIQTGRGHGIQLYQFALGGGRSYFSAISFGEMLPRPENRVSLDPDRRDAWGIPILRIDCALGETELALVPDQLQALHDLARLVDATLTRVDKGPRPPGSAVHECGTARMGWDPANSVLDPNNQCWDAQGLYVTDASCFPSQGTQNPTLTILALTARACNHALKGLGHKSGIAQDQFEPLG